MMDEPPVMVADEVVRKAAARMKKLRATPDYGLMEFEGWSARWTARAPTTGAEPQRRQGEPAWTT
jgi:hypothetical protein